MLDKRGCGWGDGEIVVGCGIPELTRGGIWCMVGVDWGEHPLTSGLAGREGEGTPLTGFGTLSGLGGMR